MNEIDILKKRVEELEHKLNEFMRPGKYSFGKTVVTETGSKLGFFGVDPIFQPTTTGTTADMTVVGSTAVSESNGFGGGTGSTYYTIGDIVKHLKLLGLLKF